MRKELEDIEIRMAMLRWSASTPERMREFETQIGLRFISKFLLGAAVGFGLSAVAFAVIVITGAC